MTEFGRSRIQEARIKMPDTEDLIPDAPTDAVGRYVVVLRQWEDLTRRQAKYEEELRKLHAAGDALQAEWDSLAAEHQSCLKDLGTLATPPQEIIERVWDLMKAHLWMLCQIEQRTAHLSSSVPSQIKTLAEPLRRDPRILE